MKKWWAEAKAIISDNNQRENLFISLIEENGNIVCANANMVKGMELKNPREVASNFFDMLYHAHQEKFNGAIRSSYENNTPYSVELYLRNGHYHPMKWQVNCLQHTEQKGRTYLCVGYKLAGDKQLEKFNELSQQHHQLILEGLNTGILFQDKKGEVIACNQKTAEIFETTLEQLYQLKDIKNLWNSSWNITTEKGDHVPFDSTPFMRAMQTGKKQEEIFYMQLRNGEGRWILFNSHPLMDTGNPTAFSVVSNIRDITQEKILAGKAKEREALFQAFMKTTPNLAWVVDEEENLVFASDSFYRTYGLNKEELLKEKLADLLPRAVFKSMYKLHALVFETEMPVEREEKTKLADGTNISFHLNIFPIPGVTGKKMVGGHAVNLADKYAIEKQLREANDRLLNLSRATSNAVWEWDMQTGQVFRNEALLDMIGYPMEETKGLTWWFRRIHPEDRNRVSDNVKEATEKNLHSWEGEYRFKCVDGSYKQIRDRGYIVYENELPVKMIGSLEDISSFKELEDKLVEEKLQRQKEISETVIQVQEKERTRIGHELHDNVNQILSTVKLFVNMLKPTTKEEKEIIAKTDEYILMAIEEIRKLSKELVVPQINSKGLVHSIQTVIDDIHFSSDIRIKFTHDHENDLLSPGKKVTLLRIVQEQLKNILKHSKAKQVDIFLQSKESNTQLIIKDNGAGFDPKHTHQGIGLSNIHERTRFYNGSVELQTSQGNGCSLIVTLPSFQ